MKKTKAALTLAEVLIALTIIGIVAAITIPALMQSTQDQELKVAYKKTYSEVSQAYRMVLLDNGSDFPPYGGDSTTSFNAKWNALKSHLYVVKDCSANTIDNGCWTNNANLTLPIYDRNWQNSSQAFLTKDGRRFLLYNGNISGNWAKVYVDLNGNKGPNTRDKDISSFLLDSNKIGIEDANSTQYLMQ